MIAQLPKQSGPVLIRTARSIGGLYPDVVIEEAHEDSLEITEHPVEQGAAVSDHAYKKPQLLTIQAGVSDTSPAAGENASVEFYEKLLELQKAREPFDIVTGKRVYKNMLLESLSAVTTVDTEHALKFTAQCREVIIAHTRVTTVPPRERQANPNSTGAPEDKGQQQAQQRESILAGAAGGGRYTRPGGAAPGYEE